MGDVSEQVKFVERKAEELEEIYRSELEDALGEEFYVGNLTRYDLYSDLEDHFFKLHHGKKDYGIILPFRKMAYCGNSESRRIGDKTYPHVHNVLVGKGYEVTMAYDSNMNLVERARRKVNISKD